MRLLVHVPDAVRVSLLGLWPRGAAGAGSGGGAGGGEVGMIEDQSQGGGMVRLRLGPRVGGFGRVTDQRIGVGF